MLSCVQYFLQLSCLLNSLGAHLVSTQSASGKHLAAKIRSPTKIMSPVAASKEFGGLPDGSPMRTLNLGGPSKDQERQVGIRPGAKGKVGWCSGVSRSL